MHHVSESHHELPGQLAAWDWGLRRWFVLLGPVLAAAVLRPHVTLTQNPMSLGSGLWWESGGWEVLRESPWFYYLHVRSAEMALGVVGGSMGLRWDQGGLGSGVHGTVGLAMAPGGTAGTAPLLCLIHLCKLP